MKNKVSLIWAVAAIALLSFRPAAHAGNSDTSTSITVVGDSTVTDYPLEDVKRGWGQILRGYFKPSTKFVNLARGGRSTKTFLEEGLWKKALDTKADFIFIQFGHNDSHSKDQPEATDANTDYMEYLRGYVKEAREIKAMPILVTPPHRLTFEGSTGKLTQELKPYVDAMKRVAAEMNVPVIDLYQMSGEAFEPLGDSGVSGLTASAQDRTHFTEKGATILAELVAKKAVQIDPRLQSAIK